MKRLAKESCHLLVRRAPNKMKGFQNQWSKKMVSKWKGKSGFSPADNFWKLRNQSGRDEGPKTTEMQTNHSTERLKGYWEKSSRYLAKLIIYFPSNSTQEEITQFLLQAQEPCVMLVNQTEISPSNSGTCW